MTRKVYKKGKWKKGKAGPELLKPHLRSLPSEYVTKEIPDGSKIHELDHPHIVEALLEELRENEKEGDKSVDLHSGLAKLKCAQPGETIPLSQWEIDVVRCRVMNMLINGEITKSQMDPTHDIDLSVRHVWFPNNNVNEYFIRDGNPPADCDRPMHMRGFKLHVDLFEWPEQVRIELERRGVKLPDLKSAKQCVQNSRKVVLQ